MKRGSDTKTKDSLKGVISVTRRGVGYVTIPEHEEDIEIDPRDLNTALDGDTVEVILLPKHPSRRQQGKVRRVLERAATKFTGTLLEENGVWLLAPDSQRMYVKIRLAQDRKLKLAEGLKAFVEMKEWSDPKQLPEGQVLELLGKKGENEAEMRSILLGHSFDDVFSTELLKEAEAIAAEGAAPAKEAARRRDFRGTPTFTIDPVDAKDFDDALSFRRLPDGDCEIGVHIADVAYFVRPGTVIDREARKRGTSVYLVDRVIPMLPEILSNNICSLRPDEDRLAFSAVFTLDQNGSVKERWFGETVIRSQKRFSYEEAQEVLDSGTGPFAEELRELNALALKIREKRFREGSIDFDQEEVRFRLDEKGKPLGVYKKPRLATNMLIEDFMLLANREVAFHVYELSRKNPSASALFIYRIHDVPDAERIEELAVFLRAIGYELKTRGEAVSAKHFTRLFKAIEGKPEEALIKVATIRSMAKAVYSTKNIGHFGLSFQYYTHFTSPIRRYPDTMVHRILKSHLDKKPLSKQELADYEFLTVECSKREVEAAEAERESIKYKQVEYMQNHVGEIFDGVVSGVTEWGMYVEEVNTKAEGLVHVRALGDDYYTLDKKNYRLIGEKKKKKYALGDRVRVKLTGADLEARTLDFKLV